MRANAAALGEPGRSAAATTHGANASLVYAARTGGGVVVVDLGWTGAARGLARALAPLGAVPADVRAVLLTHAHRDHLGAWRLVRGATFYVGAGDVPRLFGEARHRGWIARAGDWARAPDLPRRGELRVVPVSGDTAFAVGADSVRAFAVPGHTPGSVAWLVRGVLFLGDAAAGTRRGGRLRAARAGFSDDAGEARRSLARLRAAVAPYGVRTLCTAHARCAPASDATWADLTGGQAR